MTPNRQDLLAFRPMGRADLAQVRAWLAEPHVAEWWEDGDEAMVEFEAALGDGPEQAAPAKSWIVELDGDAIGFITWYRVEDELDWYPGVDVPPATVALDIAIGDPSLIGQGVGRRVVLEFVHHVLRAMAPGGTEVWIDPNPRNQRAVRCYRAVGFSDTGIDLPDLDDATQVRRLMRLRWGPVFP